MDSQTSLCHRQYRRYLGTTLIVSEVVNTSLAWPAPPVDHARLSQHWSKTSLSYNIEHTPNTSVHRASTNTSTYTTIYHVVLCIQQTQRSIYTEIDRHWRSWNSAQLKAIKSNRRGIWGQSEALQSTYRTSHYSTRRRWLELLKLSDTTLTVTNDDNDRATGVLTDLLLLRID